VFFGGLERVPSQPFLSELDRGHFSVQRRIAQGYDAIAADGQQPALALRFPFALEYRRLGNKKRTLDEHNCKCTVI